MTQVITVTTQPIPDPQTPTPTHYQEVAQNLLNALDAYLAAIPKVDEAQGIEAKQVRRNLNVPDAFCYTAIAVVEQYPELEGAKTLHAEKNRNRLQFLEAFRPVQDKFETVGRLVQHALFSIKSEVASDSLEVYRMARARMKRSPALAVQVEALKRDLGKRIKTKAEREQKKVAKFEEAVERAIAQRAAKGLLTIHQQKEVKAA